MKSLVSAFQYRQDLDRMPLDWGDVGPSKHHVAGHPSPDSSCLISTRSYHRAVDSWARSQDAEFSVQECFLGQYLRQQSTGLALDTMSSGFPEKQASFILPVHRSCPVDAFLSSWFLVRFD